MQELPTNIEQAHLLAAIQKIDKEGIPTNAHSSTYDLIYKGKSYPPKLVLFWVNLLANKKELDRSTFQGAKWLSLVNQDLIEGVHYSIMFYGGRLLSHLEGTEEYTNKELISLFKINTNSYIIIDSDKRKTSTPINATKKRILTGLSVSKVWITQGKEIENYYTERVLQKWIKKECKY